VRLTRVAGVFALVLGQSACLSSHGLMQTAHTEPPGKWRLRAGLASVLNDTHGRAGRDITTTTSPEPALRAGVTGALDAGLSPWLGAGLSLDAKLNLFDNRGPFALAPRVALGFAMTPQADSYGALGIEAGVIASYRFVPNFEPYLGLQFANHWLGSRNFNGDKQLARNQAFAARSGSGDGLVKFALGFQLSFEGGWLAMCEYGHWVPAQNDPGDGYRFMVNDIVAFSVGLRL
jgi:hypothetical protein